MPRNTPLQRCCRLWDVWGGFVALDTGGVAVLEEPTYCSTEQGLQRGCAVVPAIVGLTS